MTDPLGPNRTADPETLKALATLRLKVRKLVQGLQGGAHQSQHFGPSVEFAENRRYSPGDDIRTIDWNAFARTDRYFVKQHQKEVVLSSLMILDTSASMGYRGSRAETNKVGYAAELIAAMVYVLIHQGDAAGLLTFASTLSRFIPPGRRPDQLALLMRHLAALTAEPTGHTGYTDAIGQAARYLGKRGLVVLVSDLWGAKRESELALARLAARGHDIALFHLLDPDEIDLPFSYPISLQDMEGPDIVDVDPIQVREDYRQELSRTIDQWRRFSGENGIDYIQVSTAQSVAVVLSEFASRRHRGQRRVV